LELELISNLGDSLEMNNFYIGRIASGLAKSIRKGRRRGVFQSSIVIGRAAYSSASLERPSP
jgi:hypothetical protein